MNSRRQLKISSLIKEAFTEVLSRTGKGIYGKAFVTVTNTTVNSDLTLVRFYLSVFNTDDADEVVKKINEHKFEIKRDLVEKLRHQLRRVPEIEFFRDDTLDYVYHMEEVFKKINTENQELSDAQLKSTAKKKSKPDSEPKVKTVRKRKPGS